MKKTLITLLGIVLCGAAVAVEKPAGATMEQYVDALMRRMTLEEKVHLVIGCGMSMGSDTKFPGTAGRTYDIPRLGIPSAYLADGPHRLAMAAKREFDSRTYHATEFPSSTTWQLLSIRMQPIRWDVLWVWK